MVEAQNGFATLKSVDEGTMRRFIKWAYLRYYTPAEFSRDLTISQPPASTSSATEMEMKKEKDGERVWPNDLPGVSTDPERTTTGFDDEMSGGEDDDSGKGNAGEQPPRKKNKKPKTRSQLKSQFLSRRYKYAEKSPHCERSRPNTEPYEDYTEVFLSHARVHVFADMYDIQPLREQAFENLHSTLGCFNLYRQRTGDIVALLNYVISHTNNEIGNDANHLRNLLGEYMAYEMSALMKDENFIKLLVADGGALLADFFKKVALRIH